jgi:hypothetical protein
MNINNLSKDRKEHVADRHHFKSSDSKVTATDVYGSFNGVVRAAFFAVLTAIVPVICRSVIGCDE